MVNNYNIIFHTNGSLCDYKNGKSNDMLMNTFLKSIALQTNFFNDGCPFKKNVSRL